MPDIHIHRPHTLGLPKARQLAVKWTEDAKAKFALECTLVEGPTSDTVRFSRAGVSGTLLVEADQFTLDAKLAAFLGGMSKMVEAQIGSHLDALLKRSA